MCNLYSLETGDLFDLWSKALRLPVVWEGQASNFEPRPEIKMTETAPIIRHVGEQAVASMTPWAWRAPSGKPVFNFVTEGRDFSRSDRVLIPADAFYEFTAKLAPSQKRLTRWKFTMAGNPVFWIAGIVQQGCWTMLTTSPGEDIKPYHDRQVVVLPADQGRDWLDLTRPQAEILAPAPAGALQVVRDFPPPDLFG
ncbi:putative SOS response-associated peptidase YedK [Caulobacter rhizosphaerae]|uniref:SOS response-associated peptidase YedK n=1 Tax=Caulobacter rhizosphaerae TaxID=2010972 RepID=A0ABU1MW26_9CAUL|nr:SOS response-associated peptidase family protein [Caulobacter rhizosphaerae]MDR6530293.1 putative SOS response-associated peptidase YedK [Caulobacter rhizosphaerae]